MGLNSINATTSVRRTQQGRSCAAKRSRGLEFPFAHWKTSSMKVLSFNTHVRKRSHPVRVQTTRTNVSLASCWRIDGWPRGTYSARSYSRLPPREIAHPDLDSLLLNLST